MNEKLTQTPPNTERFRAFAASGALMLATFFGIIEVSGAVDKIPGYSTKDAESGGSFALFLDGSIGARVRSYNHTSTASIPKSHGLSIQGRVGFRLWNTLLLGAAPEYQILQQFDKNGAFIGNWSGSEVTLIKPIIGLHYNSFQIVLGYGLSPELDLSSKTSTNQTLSYTEGTSYQGEVDFKCSEAENITLHYSFGSYANQILDGVTSPLTAAVKWSAFGIGYTRNFF